MELKDYFDVEKLKSIHNFFIIQTFHELFEDPKCVMTCMVQSVFSFYSFYVEYVCVP